ncbi:MULTISPECIES: acyl carrier protein [Streptomyces]|uniref:Acyl carrier protein n=1 Tax=Streptomyces celluloflavus TaxID=58344 RepID=A0ABW7RLJ2_9ACTN|nr:MULTISPECIES: acyl carrier protein [Streptomyces]MYU52327.1 acyl carrier protein [Streptomyces sp. SID7805]WSK12586.1 acyl carrier protein [Streptomyces celluloflavus]
MTGDLVRILTDDLKLPADRLTDDASLDHAGFDSLVVVELSVLLADRYGIDISDSDIKDAATLGQLDLLITSKRSGR